jgi:hypothetical protein
MPNASTTSSRFRCVLALTLSLALCQAALGPSPAGAQAPRLRVVVERPALGSTLQEMVVISGWATDLASTVGTGIVSEGVEVWLGPADTGQLLGTAGYGDPRPDVAEQLGDDRHLLSGFRFFWNSCEASPGANELTVRVRTSAPRREAVAVAVPITVEPCTVRAGEMVQGEIVTSGQADAWTFEGTAGDRVSITLDGYLLGGWDPVLELIAPDGRREDVDDDSGPDLDAWLSRRLSQTGTYTVLARPFSNDGCTGDYVVLGWAGAPERSDPNRAAGALGEGTRFTYRGSVREFGERQAWRFEGQAGEELILYLTRNVGSRLDPFVELQAPDGHLLAQDDDSGGGLNSFLQGVLPQDGTYTVVAHSARDDCGGPYELRVEPEWGSHSRLRGELPFGEAVPGSLSRDVRRDVWSFPATAGERATLTVETNGPTRVQVAAPSGDWEQGRATRGQPLGLSFLPAESGTYQAVVFVDTSRPIDYALTLERGYGRLVVQRGAVPLGRPVAGEIQFAGGRDLYTFEARQGQQVRIALDRPARSQLDPYLELLDPDGRTLAEDDDSGGELNALIQVPLARTGTYTIVARGFEDTTGPYTLTVTLTGEPTPTSPSAPNP